MSGICLKFWYENILFTTFWLNSITCFKMFLRKVLLDQCPISMIMDNEHGVFPKIHRHGRAQSNRVCADIFLFMPSFTYTISPTVSVNTFIMWVDVTCSRHSLMVTVDVEIGES